MLVPESTRRQLHGIEAPDLDFDVHWTEVVALSRRAVQRLTGAAA